MLWTYFKNSRLGTKVIELFTQGLTPKELALSLSISLIVGIIPMFGVTTIMVTLLAIIIRINLPISILVTLLIIPLQIFLFIPFISFGGFLCGLDDTPMIFDRFSKGFEIHYLFGLRNFAIQLLYGLLGWLTLCVPIALLLFFILWQLIKRFTN